MLRVAFRLVASATSIEELKESCSPLRKAFLSREELVHKIAELGVDHRTTNQSVPAVKLVKQLRKNFAFLKKAYKVFLAAGEAGELLPGPALWLLDNYHVLEAEYHEIIRALPTRYYKSLPRIADGPWKGFPCIYQIACELIARTDSVLESPILSECIEAYQHERALLIGELWALPIMLRLGLMENMQRLVASSLLARHWRTEVEERFGVVIDSRKTGTELLVALANAVSNAPDVMEQGVFYVLKRLREKGSSTALAQQWVLEKFKEKGVDVEVRMREQQQLQAADQVSVGNVVSSLRRIDMIDWHDWFEGVSCIDKVLRQDPVLAYGKTTFQTRDRSRQVIEKVARKSGLSEILVAERAIELCKSPHASHQQDLHVKQHVGYYLLDDDGISLLNNSCGVVPSVVQQITKFFKQKRFPLYVGSILSLTLLLSILVVAQALKTNISWPLMCVLVFLLIFPVTEFSTKVIQFVLSLFLVPRALPRMDFSKGISREDRTVVVVHSIAASRASLFEAISGLEVRYVGNKDANLLFGLLVDLPDSPSEVEAGDALLIGYASELIKALNERYATDEGVSQRFFLLFRKRLWNESEGSFICWERKRGKLAEFNRLLRGAEDTSFYLDHTDLAELRNCRFVITLDRDAELPPGTARKLVGTAAHPLNLPVLDQSARKISRGYGIIQPRIGTTLRSAVASRFTKIFSGQVGIDPYTTLVSEVYQDLFGEASYVGKGIYHIDAFEKVLHGRVPENSILSHDLFEGIFARTALVSDLELFDAFPKRVHTHMLRQQRWIRGDWQLLPWIFSKVPEASGKRVTSELSSLGRWKLIDNLRRSLVDPFLFLSLLIIWFGALAPSGWLYALLLVLLFFPAYSELFTLWRRPWWATRRLFLRGILGSAARQVERSFLYLCFLPYTAWVGMDAIVRTLYRLLVSRKHLLEWESAMSTERRLGWKLRHLFLEMFVPWAFCLGLCLFLFLFVPEKALEGGPVFLVWLCGPGIAWFLTTENRSSEPKLRAIDRDYLRTVGYKTWTYFETYLCPEYNYLIPDNLQVVPKRIVAERTSPTNISLSLLAVVSAYDLGFISILEALQKINATLENLKKLERFQGHFLNWYQIRELRALHPRFVSTVDNGNLVAHFIVIREALRDFANLPILRSDFRWVVKQHLTGNAVRQKNQSFEGDTKFGFETFGELFATLETLAKMVAGSSRGTVDQGRLQNTAAALLPLLGWMKYLPLIRRLSEQEILHPKLKRIERVLGTRKPSLSLLSKVLARILRRLEELDLSVLNEETRAEAIEFRQAVLEAERLILESTKMIQDSISLLSSFINEADFRLLFDSAKELLVIGYNLDAGQKWDSHYDLLASEARLASFVAIAKGDLPSSHWFKLGRAITRSPGGNVLVSWSGTMFEYLMPCLVTELFEGTLIAESAKTAVRAQRHYAGRYGVPWGISESAYAGVDFEKTYQYRAFGVPGLGLKRGLGEDLVISPYSTALALMVDPGRSTQNLQVLENLGMLGEFGFFEAIDFTPERLRAGEKFHIVKNFLAHHQGMTLISLNNALSDNICVKRFHRDASVASCELLLQERLPTLVWPSTSAALDRPFTGMRDEGLQERSEVISSPHTAVPRVWFLSNGRYSVHLDNSGGGASNYAEDLSLTRWHEDPLRNNFGSYFYIKDVKSGNWWSATYQPSRVEPERYEVVFSPDRVEYLLETDQILSRTEVVVSPEDNVEIRKLHLANLASSARTLEVTSYSEIVNANAQADLAHPAFSKMFIESEFIEELDALIFFRRPREAHEHRVFIGTTVTSSVVWARTQFDSSRMSFIGRGRGLARPKALDGGELGRNFGVTLDPISSLRTKVELDGGSSHEVFFLTAVAESKEELVRLLRKYRELSSIRRAFELAWSQSDVELRHSQFSLKQVKSFFDLGNALAYPIDELRAPESIQRENLLGQQGLWRFGISGDEAIVLVVLTDPEQLALAQELLLAHEFLRLRGVRFDLVILNEYITGYLQPLQEELELLIKNSPARDRVEKKGGVYLRLGSHLSAEEKTLLLSWSRVVLYGEKGALSEQINIPSTVLELPPERPQPTYEHKSKQLADKGLQFENGIGGFSRDGKSYVMRVLESELPPHPWSNVIANDDFGFLITESGGGYTWAHNSRENRLSPWNNDFVRDPPVEVLYLRDMLSGEFWSLTPRPRSLGSVFRVEHGFGYTSFSSENEGLASELTVSMSPDSQVKWWVLNLRNLTGQERPIEIFLYFEWILSVNRNTAGRHLQSGYNAEGKFIYAKNPANPDYPQHVAFIGSSAEIASYTTSRAEFLGRHGDVGNPAALARARMPSVLQQYLSGTKVKGVVLSKRVGAGMDSAAALKLEANLPPAGQKEILFYLGYSPSLRDAEVASQNYRSLKFSKQAIQEQMRMWRRRTAAIVARTPDAALNLLINGWLMYQTVSCRMMARSGFYQSSGAIGFRDQLQDSLALLLTEPQRTLKQIRLHASRQFVEGDVQHWWHPPTGKGIRTRISDNYLWLIYAVIEYLEVTGNSDILEESISFIEGPVLEESESSNYNVPRVSDHRATLYEHCVVGLDRALVVGEHGLPLIGSGDWNDGFDRLGVKGKGESIWLGWFLASILERFAVLVEYKKDRYRAAEYRQRATAIVQAIESKAWDGAWYIRAFSDEGKAIGSAVSSECAIDSIAQSWSIISGLGDKQRAETAFDNAVVRLVREKERLILLLAPPFNSSDPSPGYIQGYPPGIRENGGQYSHAAAWLILGSAILGRGTLTHKLFSLINPIGLTATPADVKRYKNEPYVMSGDVYYHPQHVGQGGWSWYTGSSAWLYRVAVEYILGLKLRGDYFTVNPVIPGSWKEFGFSYTRESTVFEIQIENPDGIEQGVISLTVNGVDQPDKRVKLSGANAQQEEIVRVKVIMGKGDVNT